MQKKISQEGYARHVFVWQIDIDHNRLHPLITQYLDMIHRQPMHLKCPFLIVLLLNGCKPHRSQKDQTQVTYKIPDMECFFLPALLYF